jgi:hypothetical protein
VPNRTSRSPHEHLFHPIVSITLKYRSWTPSRLRVNTYGALQTDTRLPLLFKACVAGQQAQPRSLCVCRPTSRPTAMLLRATRPCRPMPATYSHGDAALRKFGYPPASFAGSTPSVTSVVFMSGAQLAGFSGNAGPELGDHTFSFPGEALYALGQQACSRAEAPGGTISFRVQSRAEPGYPCLARTCVVPPDASAP